MATYDSLTVTYDSLLAAYDDVSTAVFTAAFDAANYRVTLTASGLNASTASTTIVRWDGAEPQTAPNAFGVRGGNLGAVTSGTIQDYEYVDLTLATYQLKSFDGSGALLDTVVATVTPTNSGAALLRSVFRPYLNRAVTVSDFTPVSYAGRGTVFNVLGASAPVAVTDVLSQRSFGLTLVASTQAEETALALFFAPGDIVEWDPPTTAQGALLPARAYCYVAGVQDSRRSTYGVHRYFDVSLVEVARPDAGVIGLAATWQGIVANYATWTAVTSAFATWSAVTAYVNPSSTIVS